MHSNLLRGGLVSTFFLLINNVSSQTTSTTPTVVAAGISGATAGSCGWASKCPANAPCCSVSDLHFIKKRIKLIFLMV